MTITLQAGISLRALRASDAPAVFACALRNFDRLRPWFDWATDAFTEDAVREELAGMEAQAEPRNDLPHGIFTGAQFAGSAGLYKIDYVNNVARIGYWIDAAYAGKGLVTSAVRALVDLAFAELGLNRIEIRCAPANHASRAVPQRLGFTEEGTHREVLALHGAFQDLIMYALLKREWQNRSAT